MARARVRREVSAFWGDFSLLVSASAVVGEVPSTSSSSTSTSSSSTSSSFDSLVDDDSEFSD